MKQLITIISFFTFSILLIINQKQNADLIIYSAKIYSVDNENNIFEAIAVNGNKIIAIGNDKEILSKYDSPNKINANKQIVIPGLIDSHAHIFGLAETFIDVNLVETKSADEVAKIIYERAKNLTAGAWIRGRGWDQNDWQNKKYPDAKILDLVAPNNPVILSRIDGHAIWVNSYTLKIAEVNKETRDIDGGKILRNSDGSPTGIFIDKAESIIRNIVPPISKIEYTEILQSAFKECLSLGLTSIHEMGIDEESFLILNELRKKNLLTIRLNVAAGGVGDLWREMLNGKYDHLRKNNFLSLHSIKLYIDGALGSRGAALIEPYSDDPSNSGLLLSNAEEVRMITLDAIDNDFQVSTHAIGDRGIKIILNSYEAAQKSRNNFNSRLRMEHAQVVDESDIERFAALKIIPSMQPTHATSDMYWAQSRLGPKRIRNAYAWKKFLNQNNIIASGSDFPVENADPIKGFYAAVSRKDIFGVPKNIAVVKNIFELSATGEDDSLAFVDGWFGAQKMERIEALKSFTIWGAYAEKMEKEKGSLEVGKLADIVILSNDIMEVPVNEILKTKILFTIVDGKIKYKNK